MFEFPGTRTVFPKDRLGINLQSQLAPEISEPISRSGCHSDFFQCHADVKRVAKKSTVSVESPLVMNFPPQLLQQVQQHSYPLLFATISGAHLYGFPSPDSDFDLRGVHVLPLDMVIGLQVSHETVEKSKIEDGLELDLVTHDAHKFFTLMLKKNGYVLEQVLSPLVVYTTPEHEELRAIAARCVTKFHAYHYLGFSATQWKLFQKESPPRVKPLLYVYRVLLTGIHLMEAGVVEANLVTLNEIYRLPYIADLVARKTTGAEKGTLDAADLAFHEREYQRLTADLEQAMNDSSLPEQTNAGPELNDLLIRIRRKSL